MPAGLPQTLSSAAPPGQPTRQQKATLLFTFLQVLDAIFSLPGSGGAGAGATAALETPGAPIPVQVREYAPRLARWACGGQPACLARCVCCPAIRDPSRMGKFATCPSASPFRTPRCAAYRNARHTASRRSHADGGARARGVCAARLLPAARRRGHVQPGVGAGQRGRPPRGGAPPDCRRHQTGAALGAALWLCSLVHAGVCSKPGGWESSLVHG